MAITVGPGVTVNGHSQLTLMTLHLFVQHNCERRPQMEPKPHCTVI
jgi:hypothetical protein